MNKKKWKKVIKIVLAILLIVIIVALVDFIRRKTSTKDSIDDFVSLKELVEYVGADYYKSEKSSEDGYEGDYYIKFPVDPVDESMLMGTNKLKYENVILSIEEYLQYKNIRIIDESRRLVIRTSCDKEKKHVNYTVNGVTGYFDRRLAQTQVEQNKEKISSFKISSPELNSIIKADWVRRNASLGTIDKPLDGENYDIYEDEGYKTRVLGTKIYNIVFNEKYNKEVIESIKPGTKLTDVVSILGEPTYKQVESIEGCEYIGYKLNSCYVFFSNVISIYPVVEFDESKNSQFAEAVSAFKQGGSKSEFLSKVTEIYPNYNKLITNKESNNFTELEYTLYGFKINLSDKSNVITIYSNYQGKIDNDTTVDELKLGLKSLSIVNIKFDKNALEHEEAERVEKSK